MNSKQQTKILYDDPNSFFRANKRVYLHELTGATLKTKKPTLVDIKDELKSSELISKLISKLSNLNSIMEFFSGPLQFGIQPTFLKDAGILVTSISPIIKQLMKSKRTSFNEDDILSVKTLLDDIVDKRDAIIAQNYGPALHNLFATFITNLNKLLEKFGDLLPYLDVSGKIQSMEVEPPPPPPPDDAEFQDAVEPPEYDVEVEAEPLDGAGRFKVLSHRVKQIQRFPYKRFL